MVAMPSAALLKATLAPDGAGAFPAGDSKSVDAVGLKLIPALDRINRSPSPCPTNRNKYRQPVFLVEFNSRACLKKPKGVELRKRTLGQCFIMFTDSTALVINTGNHTNCVTPPPF